LELIHPSSVVDVFYPLAKLQTEYREYHLNKYHEALFLKNKLDLRFNGLAHVIEIPAWICVRQFHQWKLGESA
jgi:hypothetical protein